MSASNPEVEWVLEQFASVADALAEPLTRIDRDASEAYGPGDSIDMSAGQRQLRRDLRDSNVVGATLADRATTPIGTEFDNEVETTVGVRLLATGGDRGHVYPAVGLRFDTLVARCRDAVAAGRQYPAVGRSDVTYHSAFIENDAPQLADTQDLFRYDFDVRLVGYEDLP